MPKTYVTFGQAHQHEINGVEFNKDTVAVIECNSGIDGREKAFEYFDGKFCFEYHEEEFDLDSLRYFPLGLVEVQKKHG